MAARITCSRHPRSVWIASCADCTAWHLDDLLSRREVSAPADTECPSDSPSQPRVDEPVSDGSDSAAA
jgi:hypothetical protein